MQLPGVHSRCKSAVAYEEADEVRSGLLRISMAFGEFQLVVANSTTPLLMNG